MHNIINQLFAPGRRVFSVAILAYLGFLLFINIMMFLPDNWMSAMGHFSFVSTGDTHDLIHEIIFALIVGTVAVGLLTQLWRPKENFTGQLVALIAWVVMILIAAITNNWVPQPLFIIFGGLTILATIFHPAGRGLFSWFTGVRANKTLFVLVMIAAIPLLLLSFTNIGLQIEGGGGASLFDHNPPAFHGGVQTEPLNEMEDMTMNDEADDDEKHIALGHYRNLGAISLIIILLGILASYRPRGWRLTAWIAGFLPMILGLLSVILPDAESSLSIVWSLLSIIWGIVFITTSELLSKNDK